MVTIVVLVFGILVAGALFWFLGGSSPSLAVEATDEDPAPPSYHLDPTPFQAKIEELESVLYQKAPPDFATAGKAARSAFELAQSMMARSLTYRVAGLKVLSFAAELDGREDVGYSLIDLEAERSRWEVVRAKVFDHASWFRQSEKRE